MHVCRTYQVPVKLRREVLADNRDYVRIDCTCIQRRVYTQSDWCVECLSLPSSIYSNSKNGGTLGLLVCFVRFSAVSGFSLNQVVVVFMRSVTCVPLSNWIEYGSGKTKSR